MVDSLILINMNEWIEYVNFAASEALAVAPCPSCGDAWFMDIEEDYGVPYTCFCCCNGTLTLRNYEVEMQ